MPRERCPQPPFTLHLRCREHAQSTVEFVGSLPLLLLAATACLQALLLAVAITFAQVAADRAARGASRAEAVASMPASWQREATLRRERGVVWVRVHPPVLLPGADRWLSVEASSREPA